MHGLFTRREPVVTSVDPDEHLASALMRAQAARDEGELKGERLAMKHAVYVAAVKGPGGLEPVELARELRMGDDL